jgi:hypothetical protein
VGGRDDGTHTSVEKANKPAKLWARGPTATKSQQCYKIAFVANSPLPSSSTLLVDHLTLEEGRIIRQLLLIASSQSCINND